MTGAKVLLMREDFPDQLTPVTTVRASSGISTEIFSRLFSVAPFISINLVGFFLRSGIFISSSPRRNFAVCVPDFRSSL